jgi:hypothetical protein
MSQPEREVYFQKLCSNKTNSLFIKYVIDKNIAILPQHLSEDIVTTLADFKFKP